MAKMMIQFVHIWMKSPKTKTMNLWTQVHGAERRDANLFVAEVAILLARRTALRNRHVKRKVELNNPSDQHVSMILRPKKKKTKPSHGNSYHIFRSCSRLFGTVRMYESSARTRDQNALFLRCMVTLRLQSVPQELFLSYEVWFFMKRELL